MTMIQTPPAAFADDAPRHRLIHTRDAGAHAASLGQWRQDYEQLSAGGFSGELEELHMGPVQVFREQANQALLQSGRPRPGTVTLGMLRGAGPANWYCGRRLEDGGVLTATDEDFELIAGARMRLSAICVDRTHLRALATRLHGQDVDWERPREVDWDRLRTGPPVRGRVGHAAFEPLVNDAFWLVRARPGLLDHAAAARMLALSLSEVVLEAVMPPHGDAGHLPDACARHRIVSRAREYMRVHAAEPITVPDLCSATGVSRRALQYAFEDVMQLSPVTYLRVMRLNRVRGELQACPCETLGDVAARWGFWHLSRFAADYRQLFGELPSATRARLAESG